MKVVKLAEHGQQRTRSLDEVHDHPSEAVASQDIRKDLGTIFGHVVVWSQDHVDLETLTITQLQGIVYAYNKPTNQPW